MGVEGLITQLRELAVALPRPGCPWEERPKFLAPPDPAQVVAAQVAAGDPLPADLLSFLRTCGGVVAMGVHNGYQLAGAADLVDGTSEGWLPRTIVGPAGAERVLPVAWDGCGNAFLLALATQRVWRWNHETAAVQQVACSFIDFLERVVADWRAYIADTDGWRFLV
jgi:hypothetical protein